MDRHTNLILIYDISQGITRIFSIPEGYKGKYDPVVPPPPPPPPGHYDPCLVEIKHHMCVMDKHVSRVSQTMSPLSDPLTMEIQVVRSGLSFCRVPTVI